MVATEDLAKSAISLIWKNFFFYITEFDHKLTSPLNASYFICCLLFCLDFYVYINFFRCETDRIIYRRMAENGFAPPP